METKPKKEARKQENPLFYFRIGYPKTLSLIRDGRNPKFKREYVFSKVYEYKIIT